MRKISKAKFLAVIRKHSNKTTQQVGKKTSRSLHISGAACLGNTIVGICKLVVGIFTLSFFTCASAFYTFGMVTAKCFALAGVVKAKGTEDQYRYYKISGGILILTSLIYILYSARLFFYPTNESYHLNVALGIATFTFVELFLNIRGVVIERHNRSPLVHAIKMINLASTLICLVLTQSALLSIAKDTTDNLSNANGTIGVIMGIVATILGVIMICRINKMQKDGQSAIITNMKKL